MSRPSERRGRTDDGFSLIEVMVAIGLVMVVMTAVLPQVIIGLRGAARANEVTEAKGVVQGQLEMMRNLPWFVEKSAEQRVDVLDRYYPDLVPPPAGVALDCESPDPGRWSGYVATTDRCSYEPGSGTFYRTVEPLDSTELAGFVLVTDAQFLTSAAPATAGVAYSPEPADEPEDGYDHADLHGLDAPVSRQLGVTVTALDTRASGRHQVTMYTQIAEDVRTPERLRAVAAATALEVTGTTRGDLSVLGTAGRLDLSGFLSRLSTATAGGTVVSGQLTGQEPRGLTVGPTTTSATGSLPAGVVGSDSLTADAPCGYVCWGPGTTTPMRLSASSGLPAVDATAGPVQASLTAGGTPLAFTHTAGADRDYLRRDDLHLNPNKPLLTVGAGSKSLSGCGAASSGAVLARGRVATTTVRTDVCVEAAATTVSLFPTATHPEGIVTITLDSAQATCGAQHGAAATAAASYAVTVQVVGKAAQTFTSGTDSQLATNQVALNAMLGTEVDGVPLSRYVGSWTLGAAPHDTSAAGEPSQGTAAVGTALVVNSTAMRNLEPYAADASTAYHLDDTSQISLRLGTVSCTAMDAR